MQHDTVRARASPPAPERAGANFEEREGWKKHRAYSTSLNVNGGWGLRTPPNEHAAPPGVEHMNLEDRGSRAVASVFDFPFPVVHKVIKRCTIYIDRTTTDENNDRLFQFSYVVWWWPWGAPPPKSPRMSSQHAVLSSMFKFQAFEMLPWQRWQTH